MRTLGVVVLVAIFLGAVLLAPGTYWEQFVDYPSMIIVFGGTLALLLISHDVSSWRLCHRFMLKRSLLLNDEDRQTLSHFFATGSRSSLACGLIGQLIGLVIMLSNMDDPAAIGPGMAVHILTILYGVVLSECVFQPLQKIVTQKLPSHASMPSSRIGLYLVFIVEALLIANFFVLVVSFADVGPEYQQTVDALRSRFGQI